MESILAIDPGTLQSGYCILTVEKITSTDPPIIKVFDSGILPNEELKRKMRADIYFNSATTLAIEMIASYGMPVGKDTFETCVWIGRFIENWVVDYNLIYRKDVKMHLCGTTKAKDSNIRQSLIDKLGPQGTKGSPGPTYGVKSHGWAALAVAVTALKL